jgi:hypothetical protein
MATAMASVDAIFVKAAKWNVFMLYKSISKSLKKLNFKEELS